MGDLKKAKRYSGRILCAIEPMIQEGPKLSKVRTDPFTFPFLTPPAGSGKNRLVDARVWN